MLKDVVNQAPSIDPNSKMLIFGGGFSGQHIASVARKLGINVVCSRRNIKKPGADFVFDSKTETIPSSKVLENVTHLVSCVPPSIDGKDPVLTSLRNELNKMPLKWIGYLSTTGVYGDSKGEWVTEKNIAKPTQQRSIRRFACEQAWISSGMPIQILRLPGIYGPGRSSIDGVKNKTSRLIDKPGHLFSRIHVDDIAGAIMHLINLNTKGIRPSIVNVADNLPASNIEVMQFTYQLLQKEAPPIETFEIASKSMSEMALSFWKENRKVSNKMLCNDLGYCLIHPDYKSGLNDCFIANNEI